MAMSLARRNLADHTGDERVNTICRFQGRERHRGVDFALPPIRRQHGVFQDAGDPPRHSE